MRTVFGVLVAIGVGFILGALATTYLGITNTTTPKSDGPTASATADSYYLCKWHIDDKIADKESPLIIKSADKVAKSMVFPWKSDADVFNVEETSDIHYLAYERNRDAPEAYSVIDLNRITGELSISNKLADGVRDLLTAICEGKTPGNQCEDKLKRIRGASSSDCWQAMDQMTCARIKNTGMPSQFKYTCRPAARPF